LSRAAAVASEDVLTAQQDLADKQAALDKATTAASRSRQFADDTLAAEVLATAAEEKARTTAALLQSEIDHLVEISFKGLRLNGLAAVFSSDSPEEFLDAAMILNVYAERHGDLVAAEATGADDARRAHHTAEDARIQAEGGSRAADEARDATQRLTDDAIVAAGRAEERLCTPPRTSVPARLVPTRRRRCCRRRPRTTAAPTASVRRFTDRNIPAEKLRATAPFV
jgi:hypothetical protein